MGVGARATVLFTVAAGTAVLIVGKVVGWRDLWGWITGWWTPGWGNLFTVGVAILAVVLSTWRAAAQFEKGREDARQDKLRAELADLLGVSIERGPQIQLFHQRLTQAAGELELESSSLRRQAKLAFVETYSPVAQRIICHTVAVAMLTDDQQLIEPILEIYQAIVAEHDDIASTLNAQTDLDEYAAAIVSLIERLKAADGKVVAASRRLIGHCVTNLRRD